MAALAIPALLTAQPNHKLVVISIDGLDARFLNDPLLKVKIPNIHKLMRNGASATVIGVAPSESWPSETSIVTGVAPPVHGIIANGSPDKSGQAFFAASAIHAETLWDAARKKGMKAATVFWPATVGADIAADLPEFWETRRGNAIELDAIAQKSTPAGLTDRVGKMFPPFEKELWDDSSAAQAAIYLLADQKPDLLLVHMAELDSEQRDTGALSIYARQTLENEDDLIGQIMSKLPPATIVALVSDHGFENSNRAVRPNVMLKRAGINGRVEVEDGLIGTTDKAVAEFLRKMIGESRKTGIAREVPLSEVKAKAPSLGRWIAAFGTAPNCVPSSEDSGPAVGAGTHLGVDGLWLTRPGYRSVLVVSGDGIRTLKLVDIDMLQIAPTLADILGVKLRDAHSGSLWKLISR